MSATPITDAAVDRLRRLAGYSGHACYSALGEATDDIRKLELDRRRIVEALKAVVTQYEKVRAAEKYPCTESASTAEAKSLLRDLGELE